MTEEEIRKAQGARLERARIAAGYTSRHGAAIDNRWKPSTYSAHERGERTIGVDDAEEYAKKFKRRGSNWTAREILFGKNDISQINEGAALPAAEIEQPNSAAGPKLDREAVQAIVEEVIDLAQTLWVPGGIPEDEREDAILLATTRASRRLALAPRPSSAPRKRPLKGEPSSP